MKMAAEANMPRHCNRGRGGVSVLSAIDGVGAVQCVHVGEKDDFLKLVCAAALHKRYYRGLSCMALVL